MSQPTSVHALTIHEVRTAAHRLADQVVVTPVHRLRSREVAAAFGEHTDVWLKLELFQHTGTFKARGALLNVLGLSEDASSDELAAAAKEGAGRWASVASGGPMSPQAAAVARTMRRSYELAWAELSAQEPVR